MGFEPTRPFLTTDLAGSDGLLSDFKAFCAVDLQLTEDTAKIHRAKIRRFMQWLDSKPLSLGALREYLSQFNGKNPYTYANNLKSLKVFCRDFLRRPELVESFKFPQAPFKPKTIPSKKDLQHFYHALDSSKDRSLFLLYASSGLRRHETLSLSMEDIDFTTCMVKPKPHNGRTKNTWLTFFNNECAQALKEYLATRRDSNPKLFPMSRAHEERLWYETRARTGIAMTPQMLREWFCNEMGSLGVQDRYIDAFCGRVPKSVLARHYSDYSPERLGELYQKADLKVLS
ncbi:tyrosine-type recombinase/integrase [Candidatus Bathyarchaeota archaeon]|nr:tyrosine-type recombinase/integrase [Candidatus Bathyarchaeota archaeon]